MAAYTPQTWIDGNASFPLSAARMTVIENGIAAAQAVPACRLSNTATISVPTGAETTMTFDTEAFDTDTMHSTSSNTSRITCKTAGIYQVSAYVDPGTTINGTRYLKLLQNGTTTQWLSRNDSTSATSWIGTFSALVKLAVNDYLELVVFQAGGSAISAAPVFAAGLISYT